MTKEEKKLYIVKYSTGHYDDYRVINIFATNKKSIATKYITKFNKTLVKWSDYYSQYEDKKLESNWIKEEFVEKYFERWNKLKNIHRCFWTEINFRK